MNNVVLHPAFSRTHTNALDADFALLNLSVTVTMTDFVRPICLPTSNADYAAVSKMILWHSIFCGLAGKRRVVTLKKYANLNLFPSFFRSA